MATSRQFAVLCALVLLLLKKGEGAPYPGVLSTRQLAPEFAAGSAGRSLALPRAGQTPAHVSQLQSGVPQEDGVQRQEEASFKEVNGESVRTVVGSYAYQSPEGLPVSFK